MATFIRRQSGFNLAGFNLVEAAIVLGVVGLVIGGIWIAASAMMAEHKATKTTEGVMVLARNIQHLVSVSDAFTLGNAVNITAFVTSAKAFPADWQNATGATNPYGGGVGLGNFTTPPRFDIYLSTIPIADCVRLVVKMGNLAAASDRGTNGVSGNRDRSGMGFIATNGGVSAGGWETVTFPISLTTARTACSLPINAVTVTFGYTRTN